MVSGKTRERRPGEIPLLPPRYRVLRLLGEGGLGRVYLARDRVDGKKVALKVLTARETANLENEFLLMARLSAHPGLIQVFDYGLTADGPPFFSMEYFPGKKLGEYSGRLEKKLLAEILAELCLALQHIHTRGLVHCDLKPGNILVREKKAPHVKILDLGLAQGIETGGRGIRGTIGYIAPEVLKGQAPDPRSDLYSLGVILYELVADRPPFPGGSDLEVLKLHLDADPPALRLPPGLPAVYAEITARLLKKNPADRFCCAEEILEALHGGSWVRAVRARETSLPESIFIGREQELATLEHLLQEFEKGRGSAVTISGEEGVGKTRLALEFKISAVVRGHPFVDASAADEKPAPFHSVRRLLKGLLSISGSDPGVALSLRELDGVARALLPREPSGERSEETAGGDRTPEVSPAEKFRAFEVLTRLAARVLSARPAILLFDNADRMDPQSGEFLRYAAPFLVSSGALLLAVSRSGDGRSVEATLDKALTFQVRLHPFTREETLLFVKSKLGSKLEKGEALAEKLHGASGGNPFFITGLLDHIVQSGLLERVAGKWAVRFQRLDTLPLPRTAGDIITKKLDELSPDARRLLALAALIGDRFTLDVMEGVLAASDRVSLPDALGELGRARLISAEPAAPGTYAFSSGLVRQATLAGKRGAEFDEKTLKALHLRIASLLETRPEEDAGARMEAVARHFSLGGHRGKARRCFVSAAEEFRRLFSYDRALACLREALELKPGSRERFPTELRQAEIYAATGEHTKARGAYEAALEALDRLDRSKRGGAAAARKRIRVLEGLAVALGNTGRYDRALKRIRQAVRLRAALKDEAGRADSLSILGRMLAMKNEYEKALALFLETAEIRERLNLRGPHGYSLIAMGNVHYFQGKYPEALDCFREALSIFETLEDPRGITAALDNLGIIYSFTREFRRARECLERSLEINRKTGNICGVNSNYNILGGLASDLGELGEALRLQSLSLETNLRIGDVYAAAVVYNNIGETYRMLGDYGRARLNLGESIRLSVELKDERHEALALCNLGLVLVEEKKRAEAGRALRKALEMARRLHAHAVEAESLIGLAQMSLEEGRPGEALGLAAESLGISREIGDRTTEGEGLRCRALISAMSGEIDDALRLAEASEAIFRTLGIDYEIGRSLLVRGGLESKAGDREAAIGSFREAGERFLRIGSRHYLARTLLEKGKLKL
jgi:serine/threonine protein kinase/tetratricopeptide (TPR) repeat protein